MTPAIFQLQKLNIPFQTLQYQHDANCKNYGQEAVDKLKLAQERVFKTLVVDVDNSYLAVAIVPVTHTLNLKNMAKTLKAKKVKMAEEHKVRNSTGYILGGVSPLGQKKQLTTVIHSTATDYDTIYVSGGKRGLEIKIAATDLQSILTAKFADITN